MWRDPKTTSLSASSACKSWRTTTLQHLFETISFDVQKAATEGNTYWPTSLGENVFAHVRAMRMITDGASTGVTEKAVLDGILLRCHNIEALSLGNMSRSSQSFSLSILRAYGHMLRHLDVAESRLPPDLLRDLATITPRNPDPHVGVLPESAFPSQPANPSYFEYQIDVLGGLVTSTPAPVSTVGDLHQQLLAESNVTRIPQNTRSQRFERGHPGHASSRGTRSISPAGKFDSLIEMFCSSKRFSEPYLQLSSLSHLFLGCKCVGATAKGHTETALRLATNREMFPALNDICLSRVDLHQYLEDEVCNLGGSITRLHDMSIQLKGDEGITLFW